MAEYANLMEWVVTKEGPVATVKFDTVTKPLDEFIEHHVSLALALEKVRFDDTVRVVILTGRDDGLFELGPMPGEAEPYPHAVMDPATRPGGPGALKGPWSLSQGIERTFAALALMEKPVIGRLNGDAYGFAMHALWGCDIVIAQEDVILCDQHLSLHPVLPWAMSAGDGAFAFLPLFMTPTKMKEFLLLGPSWTAREMADLGLINYARAGRPARREGRGVRRALSRAADRAADPDQARREQAADRADEPHARLLLALGVDRSLGDGGDRLRAAVDVAPRRPSWTVEDPGAAPGLDPQHGRWGRHGDSVSPASACSPSAAGRGSARRPRAGSRPRARA